MRTSPHRPSWGQRLAAWVALCALFVAALLPALSHAVVPTDAVRNGWVEVCSVSGMLWVKVDAEAAPDQHKQGSASAMADCAWCSTHGGHTPLLPAKAAGIPLSALGFERPLAFWQAPHLLPVWASAQSRAPPLSI